MDIITVPYMCAIRIKGKAPKNSERCASHIQAQNPSESSHVSVTTESLGRAF